MNSAMTKLIMCNFRSNCLYPGPENKMSKFNRGFVALSLIMILYDLFYNREGQFNRIKVGGVGWKFDKLASLHLNESFDILIQQLATVRGLYIVNRCIIHDNDRSRARKS